MINAMNIPALTEDVVLEQVAKIRQAGESPPKGTQRRVDQTFRCHPEGGRGPILLSAA